jgi:hypothetical protein
MVSTDQKRHLIRAGSGRSRLTACGLRNPRIYTHDPAEVDCRACQRTLFMADAELRKQRRKNR